ARRDIPYTHKEFTGALLICGLARLKAARSACQAPPIWDRMSTTPNQKVQGLMTMEATIQSRLQTPTSNHIPCAHPENEAIPASVPIQDAHAGVAAPGFEHRLQRPRQYSTSLTCPAGHSNCQGTSATELERRSRIPLLSHPSAERVGRPCRY